MSNCYYQNYRYLNKKRLTQGEFNFLVDNYYNQYYATEALTQRRRQIRNLINNNRSIQQANKNPFIKFDKKTHTQTFFFYMNTYNYKYIVYKPELDGRRRVQSFVYINTQNVWCYKGEFYLNPGQNLAEYVQLCYQETAYPKNSFGYFNKVVSAIPPNRN